MDEGASVSEITLRVVSAQNRLPSGPGWFKGHHLFLGSLYSFAHFRMGKGATTGGEEPAVLPVLANAGLKIGHFKEVCRVCWRFVGGLLVVG
tara:strand:- start:340 stop:615 length:276 start_codon:yes stop_codon:yes gene_type:complete